ncbi:hypothetical protein NX774_09625 [Massilia agilis]|uniref:Uncharacterized protein n=1 Tax=Massilia agilis TaxID=1811226 RepID=A0ABT2DA65_9BURK|nr:hypothetical protein [Massilia agilis]MCS0808177.1 hypothetical protein [Massilia agilis]
MARPHSTDPAHKGRPYLEEPDIGSGEKTPAQEETEEMIRQIPPLPSRQHGDHGNHHGGQPHEPQRGKR